MLIIDQINFAYNLENKVIRDVSLELEKGIYGIIGINGSGKTTLLNLIFGLLTPLTGTIEYNKNKKFGKKVSYVTTESYFFSYITGREHLNLFHNDNFNTDLWGDILKLPLDLYISSYSTGMKKKLSILTSLKMDKDIFIFDEPFNGLDLESCHILVLILSELKSKGKIIIITSHILDILKDICDKYFFLSDGRIENQYNADEFEMLKNMINLKISSANQGLIRAALE